MQQTKAKNFMSSKFASELWMDFKHCSNVSIVDFKCILHIVQCSSVSIVDFKQVSIGQVTQ